MRFWYLLVLAFLSLPIQSRADSGSFRYGLGFGAPDQNSPGEVKIFAFAYERNLKSPWVAQAEGGVIADMRQDRGRKSTLITSLSFGPRMQLGMFQTRFLWGPALISHPDSALGSHFQFNHDLLVGLQSLTSALTLGYKHVSNAGIKLPNRGRDFVTLRAEIYF
jgi:hypothetical protein